MKKSRWLSFLLLIFACEAQSQTMGTPKAECIRLLNEALPFAEEMLNRNGEFFPYGQALKSDNAVVNVAASNGEEKPASSELIRLLKLAFSQGARSGQYKATALVVNARVALPSSGEKMDAIVVYLNHRDNWSATAVFPYQMQNGKPSPGEMFWQQGEADVFASMGHNPAVNTDAAR